MPQDTNKIPEAPEEVQPDKRDNIKYWLKWIPASKKAAKLHWDRTAEAYREFLKEQAPNEAQESNHPRKSYSIWYSSVKTIQPALYARTPKTATETRFGVDDPQARRGCKIIERLGEYLLEESEIDDAMNAGVLDAVHADKATLQLTYDSDLATVDERRVLTAQDDGTGNLAFLEGETPHEGEVLQDEQGYFYTAQVQKAVNQKIRLCPLPYDEIIHNPEAKTWSEITEIGYKFSLNWEAAVKRFGQEKCEKLKDHFKIAKAYEEDNKDEAPDSPGKYLAGWECYCIYTKKVYWVCLDYKDDFLDVKEDPYGLHGFFPSPKFVISSKPPKSLYPTPPFTQLREIIEQMHSVQNRTFRYIKSLKRKIIIDGASPELLTALNDLDELEFVTAENLQGIVEKGGIASMIYVVPTAEYAAAIGELSAVEEKFKNLFFEWFGIPDILRGATDPIETAAAQEIKQGAAHDRFKSLKKAIQELARDGLEMMIDLALKVFDNQKIAQIIGLKYSPDLQPTFDQDMEFLRNDEENIIRINIETNSTNFVNEQLEKQEIREGTEAVLTGIQQVSAMLKNEAPQYAAVALHAVSALLEKMPGSREYVDEFKKYSDELLQQAMNPPPPAPPPPDYEILKVQVAQQKAQNEAISEQMRVQVEGRKLQQKDFELQMKAQKQISDTRIDELTAAVTQRNAQFQEYKETIELNLKEREVQIDEALAHIMAVETAITAKESMIEEARLKQEQLLETIRLIKDHQNDLTEKLNIPSKTQEQLLETVKVMKDHQATLQQRLDVPAKSKEIKIIRLPTGELVGHSREVNE